jgi:hypothetical protein
MNEPMYPTSPRTARFMGCLDIVSPTSAALQRRRRQSNPTNLQRYVYLTFFIIQGVAAALAADGVVVKKCSGKIKTLLK